MRKRTIQKIISILLLTAHYSFMIQLSTTLWSRNSTADSDQSCETICQNSALNSQLSEQCSALNLLKNELPINTELGVLMGATFLTCTLACVLPVPSLLTACTVAGITTDASEIAGIITMSTEGEKWLDQWDQASMAVTGISVMMDGKEVKNFIKNTTQDIVKTAEEKEAEGRESACLAMGLDAIVEGITLKDINEQKKEIQETCEAIQSLQSGSTTSTITSQSTTSTAGASYASSLTPTVGTTQSASNLSHSLTSQAHNIAAATAAATAAQNDFNASSNTSAAKAGPIMKLLDAYPNRSQIPSALAQENLSLSRLSQQIVSSPNLANLISLAPSLPDNLSILLNDAESKIYNNQITLTGITRSHTGITQAYIHAPTQSSVILFGSQNLQQLLVNNTKKDGSPSTNTIVRSLATQSNLNAINSSIDANDIWHTHWVNNIFQITSTRVQQVQIQWKSIPSSPPSDEDEDVDDLNE